MIAVSYYLLILGSPVVSDYFWIYASAPFECFTVPSLHACTELVWRILSTSCHPLSFGYSMSPTASRKYGGSLLVAICSG